MKQFRNISLDLDKKLSKDEKQKEGIFFTPKNGRDIITNFLKENKIKASKILEPSFGSGEFIEDLIELYPESIIYGVEKNKTLFDSFNKRKSNLKLSNQCFLSYSSEPLDLIIGNPPYFPTTIKDNKCMTGRGNIFVLFLYKCLTKHLKENGILAFVLSTSFYNSLYYEPCRKYIKDNTTILHLENIEVKYLGTTQKTMIIILKKEIPKNNNFIFEKNGNVYISPFYKELRSLSENTKTIYELRLKVKTGSIVWNQHKEKLVDNHEGKLLIYSSNIVERQLKINNLLGDEKKQYIKVLNKQPSKKLPKEIEKGPCILVSRGYGNSYSFDYIFLNNDIEFYGENHINIIYSKTLKEKELKETLELIIKSFENKKTFEFIKYFTGNGALSKTEIENVLPIFL